MSAQPYVDLLKAHGLKVEAEADLGCYQGDWVGLVHEDIYYAGGRWGFAVVGYGSCSGCDAYEAAKTVDDIRKIANDLIEGIRWFDSLDDAKQYIVSDNQLLKWHGHEDGWPQFVASVSQLDEQVPA